MEHSVLTFGLAKQVAEWIRLIRRTWSYTFTHISASCLAGAELHKPRLWIQTEAVTT